MSVKAHGKYHYFLNFTDDLSRYGYIYLMKHKSETFGRFKEFQSEVVSASSATPSWFWSIDDKPSSGTNVFVRIAG